MRWCIRCFERLGLSLWLLAGAALAQAPDYDAISEPDGEVATKQQEAALVALVQNPIQLEAVYSDASKGNVRATHVWQQVEATFRASGLKLAEIATAPECLVMAYRELSKRCVPGWSFLDFLGKDGPGANRLREVTFRSFAIRARERGLENRLILSAANGLIAIGVAATILREAEVAANAAQASHELIVSSRGTAIEKAVIDRWAKGTFESVADSIEYHFTKHGSGRTLQKYTEDAVQFFQKNKGQAQWGKWNPSWEPSYRLKIGNQGGYYTTDGRVLSYWD